MSRLKKDLLVSISITWICFFLGLSFDLFFNWKNPWFIIIFIPAFLNFYYAFVYKKRFEKIGKLKEQLQLSTEDLVRLSHASQYDIPKWEKEKVTLSWPKMCRLTDKLEEMVL